MHGLLEINFEQHRGKTVATTLRERAPLKVLKPLYPEGNSPAHLYVLNTTGGVLEGDRLEINLNLGKNTRVLVMMPAATKVHPAENGNAKQKMVFTLSAGSVFEYLPEPLLPFSGAVFIQETELFLEENATLFWGDILGPGRLAAGEVFSYRMYENHMQIRDRKGLISKESFRIDPAITPINSPGVMADYTHLGSLYICCNPNHLKELLHAFRSSVTEGLEWGVSLLPRRGIFVRVLGKETPQIQAFFTMLWALFRKIVLGSMLPPVRRY